MSETKCVMYYVYFKSGKIVKVMGNKHIQTATNFQIYIGDELKACFFINFLGGFEIKTAEDIREEVIRCQTA